MAREPAMFPSEGVHSADSDLHIRRIRGHSVLWQKTILTVAKGVFESR